jgi:hypothetical protein
MASNYMHFLAFEVTDSLAECRLLDKVLVITMPSNMAVDLISLI